LLKLKKINMSLVAYGSSSDDESDNSSDETSLNVEKHTSSNNNQTTDNCEVFGRRALKLQLPKVQQSETEPGMYSTSK